MHSHNAHASPTALKYVSFYPQELRDDMPAGVRGDGQRGRGGERAAGQLHRLLRPPRRVQQHRLPRHGRLHIRSLQTQVAPAGTYRTGLG